MVDIKTLVSLSNKYGSDPDFVLAGGGNTSAKDDDFLYVKGSGTTLATITADGFVKMDRRKLDLLFTGTYPADATLREAEVLADVMAARAPGEETKRPSVETPLHHLFPQRYVVHTHPALVNGLTCSMGGPEAFDKLFADRAVWIPLTEPGYVLSVTVREALEAYRADKGRDADLIFLQNHGVFVSGDTPEEIDAIYADVMSTLSAQVSGAPDLSEPAADEAKVNALLGYFNALFTGSTVLFTANALTDAFVRDEDAFYPASSVYTPDHMVYYKRAPLFIYDEPGADTFANIRSGIADFEAHFGYAPRIIAIRGLGFFSIGDTKDTAEISRLLFIDTLKVAFYNKAFGGPLFMSDSMIDFIENWEVESYRKKISEK
ncbi:MAG: class II aldolase/adducin family protein [Clostridiales Family XIII bacterium]|jgi:rhamnose utilization protein RhaD (predicted bifunctional aldolase and dehydrogenase)|nr:class II aldolase/adducin family protein [Clostridiales Family XIII bacterium]